MTVNILIGDVRDQLARLPDDHFDCIVTSPPYWGLRDYGVEGQIGLEPTLGEHLDVMVGLFRDLRRVLKPTGTCWLNYGDCYATSPNGRSAADTKAAGGDDRTFRDKPFSTVQGTLKPKDLCMVPSRLVIALQDDGWFVRSRNIWGKTNPMPESVSDRPATAYEEVFQLTKAGRYFYDARAVRIAPAPSTVARLAQDVQAQAGSARSNGGSRPARPMKSVVPAGWDTSVGAGGHGEIHRDGRRRDKQAETPAPGARARRFEGFNDRWAASEGRRRADSFARPHKASAGDHGQSPQFRADRDEVTYLRGAGRNLRNFEPAPVEVWPIASAPFACELCTACGRFYNRRAVGGLRVEEIETAAGKVRRRYCKCGSNGAWLSHFATFPPALVRRCLDAGCPEGGRVLDPFGGAGTTAVVADERGLDCTLIELNPDYAALAMHRIADARGEADILMGAA